MISADDDYLTTRHDDPSSGPEPHNDIIFTHVLVMLGKIDQTDRQTDRQSDRQTSGCCFMLTAMDVESVIRLHFNSF